MLAKFANFYVFVLRVEIVTILTVDFNSFFRTAEVRCKVQKFMMKHASQFVKLTFDWLLFNV